LPFSAWSHERHYKYSFNFDGYNFWLNKLNQFNGNFVEAEMVKAFILSGEYRQRFWP